jgi:hypothetical protein
MMGEGGYPHEEVEAKFIEEVGSRITQGSKAPNYRSKQMLHGFPHSEWSQMRRPQKAWVSSNLLPLRCWAEGNTVANMETRAGRFEGWSPENM